MEEPIVNRELATNKPSETPALFEESSLKNFGYNVLKYNGKIPIDSFKLKIDKVNKDHKTTGSRHQIFVEPDEPVCHKTQLRQEDSNDNLIALDSPVDKFQHLPGHLREGVFLARIDNFNLNSIPKFIGFTQLPDGRIATSEQFINNTLPVPDSRFEETMQVKEQPVDFAISLLEALKEPCKDLDLLEQYGCNPQGQEIHHNLRMQLDNNGMVDKVWLTDLEDFSLPLEKPMPRTITNNFIIGTTIYDIFSELVNKNIKDRFRVSKHQVIKYLEFALFFTRDPDNNWTRPNSNKELLDKALDILKNNPIGTESAKQVKEPAKIDIDSRKPFKLIFD
jgi:hypothetical protein